MRAINELDPLFGLELTATPFVESGKGQVPFKNVVVDYPLARAMADGFVKEPAVVTQRNFRAADHTPEQLERIKLEPVSGQNASARLMRAESSVEEPSLPEDDA